MTPLQVPLQTNDGYTTQKHVASCYECVPTEHETLIYLPYSLDTTNAQSCMLVHKARASRQIYSLTQSLTTEPATKLTRQLFKKSSSKVIASTFRFPRDALDANHAAVKYEEVVICRHAVAPAPATHAALSPSVPHKLQLHQDRRCLSAHKFDAWPGVLVIP